MTIAPEIVEAMRDLVTIGVPMAEVGRRFGVSGPTVAKYAQRDFAPRPVRAQGVNQRSEQMKALYRAGLTLEQIGRQYGVTRERVRQILSKHYDMNGSSGGQHAAALEKARQRATQRDARYLKWLGCTWDQYREVRAICREMVKNGSKYGRTPLGAYATQRRNAFTRKIEWQFNFWQWWSIWKSSGHWEERGRGQGYVMCRKGDAGPYSIDNVFIAPARENSSSQTRKKSGLPIGVRPHKGRFAANRHIAGKSLHLGTYDTPEEAYAAYLAASATDGVAA